MKSFSKVITLIFIVIVAVHCKKDKSVNEYDYKYEYYPVNIGHWVIYDVDSIVYNNYDGTIDTINYQIKEVIESSYYDNESRKSYRIERFRRDSIGQLWKMSDIWSATLTTTTLEVVEENLRFIKLIFPPILENRWNGNAYISALDELSWYKYWEYEYTAVDEPKIIGGKAYNNTLTVLQTDDDEDFLKFIYSTESYVKGIGLAYKELIHLTRTNFDQPYTGGFILRMTLNSYGN